MSGKIEDGDSSKQGLKGLFGFLGAQKRQTPSAEEEIKDFVADSDELLDDEKRMIHEILDLGDMDAGEIMTPRVDMILVEDTETVRQAVDRLMGTGYSRLPVFHEDIDRIVGIVHYKDLVPPVLDGKGDDLAVDYAFEPLFIPESKDVFPLLTEMQTKRQQMAIVVDEYGGTDGLITVEDIVEEIVGEIVDETDRERPVIKQEGPDAWLVDGRFPVKTPWKWAGRLPSLRTTRPLPAGCLACWTPCRRRATRSRKTVSASRFIPCVAAAFWRCVLSAWRIRAMNRRNETEQVRRSGDGEAPSLPVAQCAGWRRVRRDCGAA